MGTFENLVCTARSNTSTCLDLVFTNRRDRVFKSKVVQLGFTDHDLTVLSKTKFPRGPPKIVLSIVINIFLLRISSMI